MLITISGCSAVGKTQSAAALAAHFKQLHLKTKVYFEAEFNMEFEEKFGDSTNPQIPRMTETWNTWGAIPMGFQLSYLYNTEIYTRLQHEHVIMDCYIYEYLQYLMYHHEIEKILHIIEYLELPFNNDAHHQHFYLHVPMAILEQRRATITNKPLNLDYETRAIKSYKKLCNLGYLTEIDATGSVAETAQSIYEHLCLQ